MSRQKKSFIGNFSLLALTMVLIFSSCKKETAIESLPESKSGEDAALVINPGADFCKPTSFNVRPSLLPYAPVISITEDSLYDIQYDAANRPTSAKGKDYNNKVYNHTFDYDANNNLIFVKKFYQNQVTMYQKITWPAGSYNSMANKITVTGYLRTAGILKEAAKEDFYFNTTGKLASSQRLPYYSNTPFYYIYNNSGNLQYVTSGSLNGIKHHTFSNYDNNPNVFSKHRVWLLLSGHFSTNNPLAVRSTWHDVPAQQLRPMDIQYQYLKNSLGQIDKLISTYKYHQANGTVISETRAVEQLWKNQCGNNPVN